MAHIHVAGVVDDPAFHAAVAVSEELGKLNPDVHSSNSAFLEIEWEEFVRERQLTHGGKYYGHAEGPLVTRDGAYIGGLPELLAVAASDFNFTEAVSPESYKVTAVEALRQRLVDNKNVLVFMDIKVAESPIQRAIFELYKDICPKAVENFRALCTGEKGRTLCYKGSPFHRAVKDGWVQGGDIVTGAGDSNTSIFTNGDLIPDESFAVRVDKPGVLALANKGPHTNGSQFLVTVASGLDWLQYKTVGIGRVIRGVKIFREISELETLNDRPLKDCIIVNSGTVNLEQGFHE